MKKTTKQEWEKMTVKQRSNVLKEHKLPQLNSIVDFDDLPKEVVSAIADNKKEVKGRGFFNLKKGEKIVDFKQLKVDDIVLGHSNQFDSDNTYKIVGRRVYGDTINLDAVYWNPKTKQRIGAEDIGISQLTIDSDDFYFPKGTTSKKQTTLEIGDSGHITDKNSMFKGKLATIFRINKRDYLVKLVVDGNERSALVSKKGFDVVEDFEGRESIRKHANIGETIIFSAGRFKNQEAEVVDMGKIGNNYNVKLPDGTKVIVFPSDIDKVVEKKEKKSPLALREVEVTYENGHVINTSMAAHVTDDDIHKYYKKGKVFNVGGSGKDNMTTVKSVRILDSEEPAKNKKDNSKELSNIESEMSKLDDEINSLEEKRNALADRLAKIKAKELLDDAGGTGVANSLLPFQKQLTNEEIGFIIGAQNRYGFDNTKATSENWMQYKFDYIKKVLTKLKEHDAHLSKLGQQLRDSVLNKFNVS